MNNITKIFLNFNKINLRKIIDRLSPIRTFFQRMVQTPYLLIVNSFKHERFLEIGPGGHRIEGFETLNIVGSSHVDYIWSAERKLPFKTGTFSIVYASHILEHIPWYLAQKTIKEWGRIVTPGGKIEIWLPDGVKICKAFVDAELNDSKDFTNDGWYRFNDERDPCLWASGRIFSYGDGKGTKGHFNWHLAVYSYRYLEKLLHEAGFTQVRQLETKDIRGLDHGWINLGVVGIKKQTTE